LAKKRRTGNRPDLAGSSANDGIRIADPVNDLLGYTIFVYGPPKIGKTTFACSWPKVVALDCELRGFKAKRVPHMKIRNWNDVLKAKDILSESVNKKKYQSVLIDNVDLLYKYCTVHCCEKYGFDHPSDQGWGKGWERVTDEFLALILQLFELGYTLLFTSHSKASEVKADWESYTRIDPTLPGPARKVLLPLVDVILYMRAQDSAKEGSVRKVTTKATREYEAGDSTTYLSDIDLIIPERNKNSGFDVLNRRFKKNVEANKE